MHPATEYHRQAVATSSPLQLVVRVYDVAITACHRDDRRKLRAALTELIASLDFEKGDPIATDLYRLYEYLMDQSVSGDLNAIREILEGLRSSWRRLATREA